MALFSTGSFRKTLAPIGKKLLYRNGTISSGGKKWVKNYLGT